MLSHQFHGTSFKVSLLTACFFATRLLAALPSLPPDYDLGDEGRDEAGQINVPGEGIPDVAAILRDKSETGTRHLLDFLNNYQSDLYRFTEQDIVDELNSRDLTSNLKHVEPLLKSVHPIVRNAAKTWLYNGLVNGDELELDHRLSLLRSDKTDPDVVWRAFEARAAKHNLSAFSHRALVAVFMRDKDLAPSAERVLVKELHDVSSVQLFKRLGMCTAMPAQVELAALSERQDLATISDKALVNALEDPASPDEVIEFVGQELFKRPKLESDVDRHLAELVVKEDADNNARKVALTSLVTRLSPEDFIMLLDIVEHHEEQSGLRKAIEGAGTGKTQQHKKMQKQKPQEPAVTHRRLCTSPTGPKNSPGCARHRNPARQQPIAAH